MTADFVRTITPSGASWPTMPAAFESWSVSGAVQVRSAMQVGREWEEYYDKMSPRNSDTAKFMTYINSLWTKGEIFNIQPYDVPSPRGTISGSLTVNGAGQTGYTLNVHAITGTLLAGSLITIAGINYAFDVTADAANGATSLSLNPPIYAGKSPADNAVITYTNAKIRAKITGRLTLPSRKQLGWYDGLTLRFRECP